MRDERLVVERHFRDPKGGIEVLASTTTLAAGINTPVSTVVLAEQEFIGEDGRPFTVAEYKNMAGRAGRLGFNETGKAIILADNPFQRRELFNRYVRGAPEPIRSSFSDHDVRTWVMCGRRPRVKGSFLAFCLRSGASHVSGLFARCP